MHHLDKLGSYQALAFELFSWTWFSRYLGGVLFIVQAGNDIIKADFTHTKRTTFPTEMKIHHYHFLLYLICD